ncbi:SgcJ/EcaC family oxidoreductase [Nocardia sp. NPDC057668]|uniref:SgcJ/EcaC family oxidoreductase n=1 Tax=Nocardia sp. NPDC057668 TaxID=3346202 RepID=UPI00366CAA64
MTDETAVLALLRAQMDAWAAGDGTAFAATFTPDADFVSVIGERVQGRTDLATVMQEGFDGFMKGTRMAEPDTTTLRFPLPNVAVLVTVGDRPMPPGWPRHPRHGPSRPESRCGNRECGCSPAFRTHGSVSSRSESGTVRSECWATASVVIPGDHNAGLPPTRSIP